MKHQDQAGSRKKSPRQPGATSQAATEKQQQQQAGKSKQAGENTVQSHAQQGNATGRKAQKQQS